MEKQIAISRQIGNKYVLASDISSSPNHGSSLQRTIVCCVITLLVFFTNQTAYALSAEKTLKKFYTNVDNKRCSDAVKMRPDYSLEHCENLDRIFIHRIEVKAEDKKHAVALLEVDVEADGKNQYFIGYTQLQKVGKRWMIIGPYKSKFSYDLDDYISEFVTDGIKKNKASEGGREKRSTKKVTSSATRELPPGDATTDSTGPSSRVSVVSTSNENNPVLLSSSKKDSSSSSSRHKELEDYMAGNMPIEGKFIVILKTLRELFPEFTGNIMLADKSQRLLYFYNDNHILGGYYPLLNASIVRFPQGVYRIKPAIEHTEEGAEELDQQLLITDSIIMEKMVFKNKEKTFISDFYYLRSFFDNDQKNSLLLSPIDYKKLKRLIGAETLLYIAR